MEKIPDLGLTKRRNSEYQLFALYTTKKITH